MSASELELWAAKSSDGQFVRHSVRLKNGMTCSKILLFTDEREALSIHNAVRAEKWMNGRSIRGSARKAAT